MSTTSPRRELQSQSAVDSTTQPRQSIWQRTYSTIGFTKGYNFPLFIILAGAMFGFCLARLSYLNVDTNLASGASPGEWYWLRAGHYRIGITMHLATILPAGLLMVWQFVPIIRHKALLFHRINGYVVMLLVAVSHVGALMIVRRSFGGLLSTQAATGFLAIASAVAIVMAYWNVKKLQIDQHRAWMLRAMVWMGMHSSFACFHLLSFWWSNALANPRRRRLHHHPPHHHDHRCPDHCPCRLLQPRRLV